MLRIWESISAMENEVFDKALQKGSALDLRHQNETLPRKTFRVLLETSSLKTFDNASPGWALRARLAGASLGLPSHRIAWQNHWPELKHGSQLSVDNSLIEHSMTSFNRHSTCNGEVMHYYQACAGNLACRRIRGRINSFIEEASNFNDRLEASHICFTQCWDSFRCLPCVGSTT